MGARTLGKERNAKIAEQDFVVASHQHILGFDIAVNQLFVVCILQSSGNVLDIRNDEREWKLCALAVSLAK